MSLSRNWGVCSPVQPCVILRPAWLELLATFVLLLSTIVPVLPHCCSRASGDRSILRWSDPLTVTSSPRTRPHAEAATKKALA